MKNIVLIGMPGCGKTSIGRKAAELLNMKYVDTDEQIEIKEGRSINNIFTENGEKYFRIIESSIVAETSSVCGNIISTGGGVVLNEENITKLKRNGVIIFIDRAPELIINGVDTSGRPLLRGKADTIKILYEQRIGLYRRYADYTVENNESLESCIEAICEIGRTV